jgi:hypothetical protein
MRTRRRQKKSLHISLQIHSHACHEELAKLNRDVALRALRPNSIFAKVIFS